MCADAPDTSGINAAAKANADIAKEALDWYKASYAEQAPLRDDAARRALEVSDAQLSSMRQNDAISKDYWDYQKGTFRPLEQGIVADAQNYDTAARQQQKADQATSDVERQFGAETQQMQRNMTRMGVNPNSGKFASMANQSAMAQAAAKAGAASNARNQVELQGYARKMDAANLGRGLASNQATSAGVALNAGNSAASTGQMPMTQAAAASNMMGQGFSTAMQGNSSAGQLYGTAANISGQDSGIWGALGGIAGQFAGSASGSGLISKGLMAFSDVNAKQDISPVSGKAALAAIEKTPVSEWTYKPGEGDGGRHIGPMAQDVQQTMGDGAAPGGKAIDLVTMNGMTMAAVAELSKKVGKLAKAKGVRA